MKLPLLNEEEIEEFWVENQMWDDVISEQVRYDGEHSEFETTAPPKSLKIVRCIEIWLQSEKSVLMIKKMY